MSVQLSTTEKHGYFYSERQAIEAAQRLKKMGCHVIAVEEFEAGGSEATHIVRYTEDDPATP